MEQIADVHIPHEVMKETIEVMKVAPQERVPQRASGQDINAFVIQAVEGMPEVFACTSQE